MLPFLDDPELLAFFSKNPECICYINYFTQQKGKKPCLKDFEVIASDPEYKAWSSDRKNDFWAFVGTMYYTDLKIDIAEDYPKELAKNASQTLSFQEHFHEIMDPVDNLHSEKEKYEYLLWKLTELEGFLELEVFSIGTSRNVIRIIKHLRRNVEFYERKVKTFGHYEIPRSDKESPTAAQIALFFYYLEKTRVVQISKPAWVSLLGQFRFNKSANSVRNSFYKIGSGSVDDPMTLKNLSFIIGNLLRDHPTALRAAKNDYYALEKEISE